MVPMSLEINNVGRKILWSLFAAFCSENNLDRRGEPVAHARAKLSDFTAQSSLPCEQPAPSYTIPVCPEESQN